MSETYKGKPCRHGHAGVRYTVTNRCVECDREQAAQWRRDHPKEVKAYRKKKYQENKAVLAELRKKAGRG